MKTIIFSGFLVVSSILIVMCSPFGKGSKVYETYIHETHYVIVLNEDLSFVYSYEGHQGNSTYSGTYEINGDAITLLNAQNGKEDMIFLVYDAKCLAELESREGFCVRDSDEWTNEKLE